jgi:tRNA-2-methylthio-N6-dimethylallyladenosine synthase
LRETLKVEVIERIWFLTSYPRDFSDELIDVIASCERISRSIHLPVQSGSNRILKAMNRGYTREYFLDLIRRVRDRVPDSSLSTDVIVGFPGETEADYEDTVSLINEVRFERVNLAMYSPRVGTLSARKLPDDIPQEVKIRRLNDLLALQKRINRQENEKYLNMVIDVIGEGKIKGNGKIYGRTMNNKIVIYHADVSMIGTPVKIKVDSVSAGPLYGEIVGVL